MRTLERFAVLLYALLLAVLIAPIQLVVLVARTLKIVFKIIEETLIHFIKLIREEVAIK
jgi:hypothetical protein